MELDTKEIAKIVLSEISKQGKFPSTDGIFVTVVACEKPCGTSKEEWESHYLGKSVYNPKTAQLSFEPPDPTLPKYNINARCMYQMNDPDSAAVIKGECLQNEQIAYNYLKNIWSETPNKSKTECLQMIKGSRPVFIVGRLHPPTS